MKETRKQIVEQTRNRLAAHYNGIISAKDKAIVSLTDETHRLQAKVNHQADHITQLTGTLRKYREGENQLKTDSEL